MARVFRIAPLLALAAGLALAAPPPEGAEAIEPSGTDTLGAPAAGPGPAAALASTPAPAPEPYVAFPSASPPESTSLELPQARVKSRRPDTSAVHVKADFIRRMPGAMNDPIRAAAAAPGVGIQSDLNVRPLVRGGDADQTQVVLDGIPLLQPYHVGGTFSLLNLSTLDAVELHRDVFPAENPGSLSGVLRLKSRRPPADRVRARGNLSMVRGDAHVEAPLLADRLVAWGGAQSFLFNQSLHGLLDLSTRVSGDSAFKEDMRRYQDHINLPAFRDWHWGAAFTPSGSLEVGYRGGYSTDAYAVVVPRAANVVKLRPAANPEGAPVPVVPLLPTKEINRSKKLSIDSISAVAIDNRSHFLSLKREGPGRHYLEADLGWQTRDDDVAFKAPKDALAEPMALANASRAADLRLMDTWSPRRGHRLKLGGAYAWRRQEYHADLPWVLHDIIVNGNMDMLEPLGLFAPEGFTIAKEDSSRSNFDYLGEYPARIRFRHRGVLEEHLPSLFLSHTVDLASATLTYGVRAEYHSLARELFPAPRVDYTWRPDDRNTLLLTAGLYAQNLLPYYERDRRPDLRSEKSAQLALQWSHRFSKGYRAVLGAYGKRYHDLVTPTLVPDGTIDLDGMLLPHPGAGLTPEEAASLRATVDTAQDFQSLPDSTKDAAYRAFGGLVFDYSNAGTGHSIGTELAFHYDPFPAWSGWISADLGLSRRRDAPGQATYPFRYHRPVALSWVNWFDMPSRFDIGFAWRWALGQPYTPYTGTLDGTGSLDPVVVGARNSGRLAPFSRLDLRLSRDLRVAGRDLKAYVEVWNSMNSPNYFARDDRSGELKSAQLNWPFPLFFLGLSGEI